MLQDSLDFRSLSDQEITVGKYPCLALRFLFQYQYLLRASLFTYAGHLSLNFFLKKFIF